MQTNNSEIKQRIGSYDVGKGLLIMGVLWGHLGYQSWVHFGNSVPGWDFFAGIDIPMWTYQTFFMCAFFMISGVFDRSDSLRSLVRSAKQLLTPVFLLYVPVEFCWHFFFDASCQFLPAIKAVYLPWFLIALMWMKLFNYVVRRLHLKPFVVISSAILLHILGLWLFKTDRSWLNLGYALVFYLFYYLGGHLDVLRRLPGIVWLLVYIVTILANNIVIGGMPNLQGGFSEGYWQIPFSLLMGLSGSMAFIKLMDKIGHCAPVEYLGRRTLVLYVLSSPLQLAMVCLCDDIFLSLHAQNAVLAGCFWVLMVFVLPLILLSFLHNLLSTRYLRFTLGQW